MTGKEHCDTNVENLADSILRIRKCSEDEAYEAIAVALETIDVMKELLTKANMFLIFKKQEK